MPIAFESSHTAANSSTASLDITGVESGTDQLYILGVAVDGLNTVSTVTGGGLTWTKSKEQCGSKDSTFCSFWTAFGSPVSSFTITIIPSATTSVSAGVLRYSGADSATPFEDVVGENINGEEGGCTGGTNNNSVQTTTTSGQDASVYVMASSTVVRTITTAHSGSIERATANAGSGATATRIYLHDIASDTETINMLHSLNNLTSWAAAALVIIPAVVAAVSLVFQNRMRKKLPHLRM